MKYFDKDFFKFFMGFVAILSLSLVILLATHLYENNQKFAKKTDTSSVSQH